MNKNRNSIDVNPFFIYTIGFSLALLVYQLDWSSLYPKLSTSLVLFFLGSFLVSFLIGIMFYKWNFFQYREVVNKLRIDLFVGLIAIGTVLEFVYSRNVPLLSFFLNNDIDYTEFGIPTFHVIIVTFSSFLTVYLFNCYLTERKRKLLIYTIILFLYPLLIFNRGMILLNLSSIFFVYLFSARKNKAKIYLKLVGIVFLVLFLFGILGNVRTNNFSKRGGDDLNANDLILDIGGAKPEFINSSVPKEYFWGYLYISSPIANLQENITNYQVNDFSLSLFFQYVNSELNFDFISKRIFSAFNVRQLGCDLITPMLNAGSCFILSYSYLGWIGIFMTFTFMMVVTVLYLVLLKPGSDFFVTGVAILNTVMLFSIFNNMISFSGLSFQLIYPLLFSIKWKK